MNATFSSASFLTVVLALAGIASAQSYATPSISYAGYGGYYPGGYGYHSSTFEEGVLRGYADLAMARGQANYYNSLAAINREEAYSRYVQNREKATETYFKMRQINRAAREAEAPQRLSREQYVSLAKKQAPASLSPRQYERTLGRIDWPAALTGDDFSMEREAASRAFASRSPGDFGASSAFYGNVRVLTDSLQSKLKSKIGELDAAEYMAAKNFLLSLAYEAQQPLVAGSLAMAK
jgi:hypothetical protein